MGESRQRVVLVHELGELAGAEELLDGGHHRADVDQRLRGDGFDVLGGHPLADHTLHPGQTRADLVLDELTDRPNTTVTKVVDVVDIEAHIGLLTVSHTLDRGAAFVQSQQVPDGLDDVLNGEHRDIELVVQTQLAVDFVATHAGEVVALLVEEEVIQQEPRGFCGNLLAGTELAVDVLQRFFFGEDGVFFQRLQHRVKTSEVLLDVLGREAEGF